MYGSSIRPFAGQSLGISLLSKRLKIAQVSLHLRSKQRRKAQITQVLSVHDSTEKERPEKGSPYFNGRLILVRDRWIISQFGPASFCLSSSLDTLKRHFLGISSLRWINYSPLLII